VVSFVVFTFPKLHDFFYIKPLPTRAGEYNASALLARIYRDGYAPEFPSTVSRLESTKVPVLHIGISSEPSPKWHAHPQSKGKALGQKPRQTGFESGSHVYNGGKALVPRPELARRRTATRRTKWVDASSCGNRVHHIDGRPGTQIRRVPCLAIQSVLLAETCSKLRGSVKVEDEGAGMMMTMTVYSLPRHGQLSSLGIKIVPCPRTVPLLISERRQMHSPNPFRHDLNHS
jgi:hypothetical protein